MMIRHNGKQYSLSNNAEGVLAELDAWQEQIDAIRVSVMKADVMWQIRNKHRLESLVDHRMENLKSLHTAQVVGGANDGA
jgi:hypothetical protein